MSKLTEIGRAAQRAALLRELERCDWRLGLASERLALGARQNVLRSIRALGLTPEYDAARRAGRIRRGPRPKPRS